MRFLAKITDMIAVIIAGITVFTNPTHSVIPLIVCIFPYPPCRRAKSLRLRLQAGRGEAERVPRRQRRRPPLPRAARGYRPGFGAWPSPPAAPRGGSRVFLQFRRMI